VIAAERAHLVVATASHPGQSGKNNEDRYGVSAFQLEDDQRTPAVLAVIADGIGGHRAGEVAAELAIEMISRNVAESDASQPAQILKSAVVHASQTIYKAAQTDPVLRGMGSTCACAWIIGDRLFTASVGDSRIYLIRGDCILQLTTDHTWVQEAIDQGTLKPDQARSHPNAHVIRRYLGSRQEVMPDLRMSPFTADSHPSELNQGAQLLPGDIVILSSDGLTDLVPDSEILAFFHKQGLAHAPDQLIRLANQRGGHDNITIVALGMPFAGQPASAKTRAATRWLAPLPCLVVGLLLVVGALILGGIYWYWEFGRSSVVGPLPTQPAGQVTLFPEDAGQGLSDTPLAPAVAPSQLPAPAGGISTQAPGDQAHPEEATLTPWPTNTPESP